MSNNTTAKQKVLQTLKDYYNYSVNSFIRSRWQAQYDLCWKYYCGDQWNEELKKEFADVGAMPFVVNRIEPIITTYTSLQIASRKQIKFKTTSQFAKHNLVTEKLNEDLYTIKTQNDFQNKSTQKYNDALIGGLGWSVFGYDDESKSFFYDRVPPKEVFFDPDDQTINMTNSQFVCRSYFVHAVELKKRYPQHSKYFDSLTNNNNFNSEEHYVNYVIPPEENNYNLWSSGKTIKIVEVYYKKNVKYYRAIVNLESESIPGLFEQHYFDSFDEELANLKKAIGTKIEQLEGTQIWKGTFTSDLLLDHNVIQEQIPNQKYFPLVPLCLKRNYMNVPYGIVEGLIPLSTCLNYVWTKTIHGLNSKYLIIDEDSVNLEKMRPILRDELNRRDGMIFTKNPHQVQLINSETLLPFLERTLNRLDLEFEQRTQLFDELKGNQTNAISGVAIQARAVNAARTQNPLHATYDHMLFSEGQLMLDTIRGFNFTESAVENQFHDELMLMPFQIFTDFAPNFSTSKEEEATKFEALLNSPNPSFLLSEPLFLVKLGFTETDANLLHQAFIKMMQGSQQPNNNEGQV